MASFRYKFLKGEFDEAMRANYELIAEAGQAAIEDMAETIKNEGRADIAAAGFSSKWQKTFRVDTYPKRGQSASAAALVYHKIPYADVFETGATIRGQPKLYVPLGHVPKKIGSKRFTIKNFKTVGDLVSLKAHGQPLLGAPMAVSARQARTGNLGKVTLSKLRKGAAGAEITRVVPLFVGVDTVKLRDRFKLTEITDRTADKLAALYLKHFRGE